MRGRQSESLVAWFCGQGELGWLVGWLVGWLIGWLVGWLVVWLVGWFCGQGES